MHAGNQRTSYYELTSLFGHDTFLIDVNNVGTAVKVNAVLMSRVLVYWCHYHHIQGHLESLLN